MAAERGLNKVFNELFSADGNELYLKQADFYSLGYGKPTPWALTQQIAASVHEVAVGFFKVCIHFTHRTVFNAWLWHTQRVRYRNKSLEVFSTYTLFFVAHTCSHISLALWGS